MGHNLFIEHLISIKQTIDNMSILKLTKEVIMKHLLSFLLFLSTFSFTLAQTNHSLSFNGVDDYVTMGPTLGLDVGNTDFTINFFQFFSFKSIILSILS